jgi:hypothetical protein
MRERLKFKMEFITNMIVNEIPTKELLDSNNIIYDPAIGGGQVVSAIERKMEELGISKMEINRRVKGNEQDLLSIDYSINKMKLNGQYTMSTETIPHMSSNIAVGNPPYNDGSVGRNPIYHLFLENFAKAPPAYLFLVIQANWFTQPNNKIGKSVRNSLRKLGVYKIVINPYNTFETAKVKTCTVFCRLGYTGDITLIDSDTNGSHIIKNFNDTILYTVDPVDLGILDKVKPSTNHKTHSGNKGHTNFWRIVTSYRKENFDQVPLNPLKIMEPNFENQGGYRVFAEFKTESSAKKALEQYQSFWQSKLVTWILRKTRTSTTLDNPQISWVPEITIDHIFTDKELYKHYKLTKVEIKAVEDFINGTK